MKGRFSEALGASRRGPSTPWGKPTGLGLVTVPPAVRVECQYSLNWLVWERIMSATKSHRLGDDTDQSLVMNGLGDEPKDEMSPGAPLMMMTGVQGEIVRMCPARSIPFIPSIRRSLNTTSYLVLPALIDSALMAANDSR